MYDDPYKNFQNFRNCMPMHGDYMPMTEDEDDDLKKLYPIIYTRMYPMVKKYGDIIEYKYGVMYCPTKNEMDRICKQICDKYEEYHKDDDDDYRYYDDDYGNDDDMRQRRRRRRRRRSNEDLIRILLLRNLLGRRRHNYGYWY